MRFHKKMLQTFSVDFFAFKIDFDAMSKAAREEINELLNFANRWSLRKQTNHPPLFVRWEWLINGNFVFTFPSLFAVPPTVKAVNQLVAAPVESHVQLQCIVEAFAKPLNTWYRNEGIVFHHPASDDGMEISLSPARLPRFQFTQMTWTFFLFSLSSSASSHETHATNPNHRLIQFHVNLFRHYDPFVTNCLQPTNHPRHKAVSWRKISCYRVNA